MPAAKFNSLRSIFSMMAPADLIGVQKNVLGLSDIDAGTTSEVETLLRKMHDPDGSGAVPTQELHTIFDGALRGVSDPEKVKQYFAAVRLYSYYGGSTHVPTAQGIDWHKRGWDFANKAPGDFDFKNLVLAANIPTLEQNNVSVVLSDGNFLTPARHQIQNAELFMNFIPTHVMSRCVPYLDVVFSFSGQSFKDNGFSRPGLLRFLLGGGESNPSDVNRAMLDAQMIHRSNEMRSTMGMEAFTSPQTLVNPDQGWNKNRYNAVQDPFRPLASIESCTINVQSTIGWATKKIATLVLKLHDRSRMAELAEFIRPAAYTRTKITMTWGWSHPIEDNNPYADFINRNMRIRENFDVMNVNYSFDDVGQVTITLQLSYKGERALEEIVLGSLESDFKKLTDAVERIKSLRKELGLDDETGISKDVRGYQILEAGSSGDLPNIAPGKAQKLLAGLDSYLKQGKFDKAGSEELIKELQDLYAAGDVSKGEGPAAFVQRLEASYKSATGRLFGLWQRGPDPWLMTQAESSAPGATRVVQMGQNNLPSGRFSAFMENIDAANKPNAERNKRVGKKEPPPQQRIVSFGKIFTSTMLQAAMDAKMASDIQFYFYRVNHQAGPASGINIAEFPIDVELLKEDLSKQLAQARSDRITVVEFLNLLVNTQLRDVFSPAYGLTKYADQFDTKTGEVKGKSKNNWQGTKDQPYESVGALRRAELGVFVPPVIEMMMENVTASEVGKPETENAAESLGRATDSILRIHIYDKSVNIYPHATMLLKAGDDPDAERFAISVDALSKLMSLKTARDSSFQDILDELGIEPGEGLNYVIAGGEHGEPKGYGVTNQKRIKELVAATHPTIIIGGNASNVTQANIASKVNSLISTGLLRGGFAGRGEVMNTNGSGPGGLPLRILPANMTLTALGCPLLRNNQQWFVDFNTGTNVDTIYILTQLTHTLAPGKFESNATFTYWDAYGRYEAPVTAIKALRDIEVPKEVPDEPGKKK